MQYYTRIYVDKSSDAYMNIFYKEGTGVLNITHNNINKEGDVVETTETNDTEFDYNKDWFDSKMGIMCLAVLYTANKSFKRTSKDKNKSPLSFNTSKEHRAIQCSINGIEVNMKYIEAEDIVIITMDAGVSHIITPMESLIETLVSMYEKKFDEVYSMITNLN